MTSEIKNLPKKYHELWCQCQRLLQESRHGDLEHARDLVEFMLNYQGSLKLDLDILVPTAMMHDIGHWAILNEHFKFVTGPQKLPNGKLVHMLVGAKMAKDLLKAVDWDSQQSQEIVDIISFHDGDELTGIGLEEIYNTANKKLFHDIDRLDRFNYQRFKKLQGTYSREELIDLIKNDLKNFFYDEFKKMAQARLREIELV